MFSLKTVEILMNCEDLFQTLSLLKSDKNMDLEHEIHSNCA